MSNLKITEALCNVITEAGGTPTTADADSVTHALGTLYTTLGGTDELPNDVADRINSLSDHIGGGGGGSSEPVLGHFTLVNNTASAITINAIVVTAVDGVSYIENQTKMVSAGESIEAMALLAHRSSTEPTAPNLNTAYFCCTSRIIGSITPTITTTVGSAELIRQTSYDQGTYHGYIISVKNVAITAGSSPVVTISPNA